MSGEQFLMIFVCGFTYTHIKYFFHKIIFLFILNCYILHPLQVQAILVVLH